MRMLSDDDLDLKEMSEEELAAAWDLWFDLAQATNDDDPPYTHGVFVNLDRELRTPRQRAEEETRAAVRPRVARDGGRWS